jgi:hypothetical protein
LALKMRRAVTLRGAYRRDETPSEGGYFADPEEAFDYLERRGYTVTKNNNWLPPASIASPNEKDRIAALYLGHTSDYGGIVMLKRCPFCGGRADPFSPIGVECLDCGGNATDIETWQRRAPA